MGNCMRVESRTEQPTALLVAFHIRFHPFLLAILPNRFPESRPYLRPKYIVKFILYGFTRHDIGLFLQSEHPIEVRENIYIYVLLIELQQIRIIRCIDHHLAWNRFISRNL